MRGEILKTIALAASIFLSRQAAPTETPAPLPAPPTRDEILNVRITFQGLTVRTQQFGDLPWFEAALPWLRQTDREAAYAAKHASPAWNPSGDTHALVMLPWGPPLYDHPRQPYSRDRFGPLDWTSGGTAIDGRLADLVHEVIANGFRDVLLFLGGDDGERGYPIAMRQLDLVHDALSDSKYGDLRPYVVAIPGWDGVFSGYSPRHVADFGAKCRRLFRYCGIEHRTGQIPTGGGARDYAPGGTMTDYDLILSEFDRITTGQRTWNRDRSGRGSADDAESGHRISEYEIHMKGVWNVAARLLGPAYVRPPDQPADNDPGSGASKAYLRIPSPRGPYAACAFEWTGEYDWVRHRESSDDITRDRRYLQSLGYACGG